MSINFTGILELGYKRLDFYGSGLIKGLSVDLSARFGRGFSQRNLEQMRLFYQYWAIPQTVSAESSAHSINNCPIFSGASDLMALANRFPLPWSAYVRLLSFKKMRIRCTSTLTMLVNTGPNPLKILQSV